MMKTKIFKKLEEIKPYFNEKNNTYIFTKFNLVEFEFDLVIDSNINALDIKADNINAHNITACNIDALDIYACNIKACDIKADNINARNINAYDINASDINARNINVCNINARNINANDILYHAVCFAYQNIKCKTIKGRRKNHKHFTLDGKIEVE